MKLQPHALVVLKVQQLIQIKLGVFKIALPLFHFVLFVLQQLHAKSVILDILLALQDNAIHFVVFLIA